MPVTSGTVAVRLAVKVPLLVFLKPPPLRVTPCVSSPPLVIPVEKPEAVAPPPIAVNPVSRKLFPLTRNPTPLSAHRLFPAPVPRQMIVATCPDTGVQLTRTPCEPLTVMGADLALGREVPKPTLPLPPPLGNASTARIW